jgi:hypothetical protein
MIRASDTGGGIVTINQLHPIFVTFALAVDSLAPVRARMKKSDVPPRTQTL